MMQVQILQVYGQQNAKKKWYWSLHKKLNTMETKTVVPNKGIPKGEVWKERTWRYQKPVMCILYLGSCLWNQIVRHTYLLNRRNCRFFAMHMVPKRHLKIRFKMTCQMRLPRTEKVPQATWAAFYDDTPLPKSENGVSFCSAILSNHIIWLSFTWKSAPTVLEDVNVNLKWSTRVETIKASYRLSR